MKIAVLGAGAMGSIYGGHLSLHNDVYMIDKKQEIVDKINADGLKLFENDKDVIYRPEAMTDSANLGEVDLVILFVKALFSKAALEENRHIIGEHTYVCSPIICLFSSSAALEKSALTKSITRSTSPRLALSVIASGL